MLALIIDQEGNEKAFQLDGGQLVKYITGTYCVETPSGRDCDGDIVYHKDFGITLPKGTIKQWTGSNLLPDNGYREFDETKSYKV